MDTKTKKITASIITIVLICVMCVCLTACTTTFGGIAATASTDGLSAYEIAVAHGFTGTEQEWLDSLKADTVYVDSAYDLAVQYGYSGTEAEWLESLKGDTGDKGETSISAAVNKSILSVVSINAYFTKTITQTDPFGRVVGTTPKEYASAGSGVIFKDDKDNGTAYIVTNYHVVYDVDSDTEISDNIKIYLYGMELSKYAITATYVGGSMTYDVAVLKIENSDIYKNSDATVASIGTSGSMTVGDTVIAIGNPEASGIAVTSGILSLESEYINMTGADNKSTYTFRVMRIDAAINGGNSGGGLFNDSGELVGIVNAKIVADDIEGIAYAIPIDLAYAAVQNIINNCEGVENTNIQRCLIGISVQSTDSMTEVDETTGKVTIKNTVSIISIETGSAAASAGLMVNDVINSIRYESILYTVAREYDITNLSLLFSEGDEITINVTRNGVSQDINVTLGTAVTVK